MNRRQLLTRAAASAAAIAMSGCTSTYGPRSGRHVRIGAFTGETPPADGSPPEVERDIMASLAAEGFVRDVNLTIDWRHARGVASRYDEFAAEFVAAGVDIIIASTASAAVAAKKATQTIPIVMQGAADALDYRLVESYAHPGANITGTAFSNVDELTKRLEILHEAVPVIRRVVVLGIGATNNGYGTMITETKKAAEALGLDVTLPWVKTDADVDAALRSARDGDGVLVTGNALMFKNSGHVIEVTAARHLPAAYSRDSEVHAGGFLSYSSNRTEARQVGKYVRRIVDGAAPGELPVQLPTIFDIAINLSTARGLGLTPPATLVKRASSVVQ